MPDPEEKVETLVADPNAPGLTVDLTPKPEGSTQAPLIQKAGETDTAYAKRLSALENQSRGAARILEDLKKQQTQQMAILQELQRGISRPAQGAPVPSDDISAMLFSGDPSKVKEGIAKLAGEQATVIVQQKEYERQVAESNSRAETLLETNKQWVETRYPQLSRTHGNEEDPFSQVYTEVINQHPEWHRDPNGPKLVLQEAEDVARQRGLRPQPATTIAPNKEVIRRGRAGGAGFPPSRNGVSEGGDKVVLTNEDLEVCKTNHISPESFAKAKRALEQNGAR